MRGDKVAGRRALSIIHIYGKISHNGFSAGFTRICGELAVLKTKWRGLTVFNALVTASMLRIYKLLLIPVCYALIADIPRLL